MTEPHSPAADSFTSDPAQALRGGSRLLALRMVQFGLAFAWGVVLARALGPEGRAEYGLALTFATLTFIATHFSAEDALGRMLARGEATVDEITGLVVVASVGFGAIGAVVAAGAGLALRHDLLGDAGQAVVIVAALTVPLNLAGVLMSMVLLRLERLSLFGWISVLAAAAQLAAGILIAATGHLTPAAAMAVLLGGFAFTAILLAGAYARIAPGVRRPTRRLIGTMLRHGAAVHAANLAMYAILRIDLLVVSAVAGKRDTGFYAVASSLAETVYVACATIALAALPTQTFADERTAVAFSGRFTRAALMIALALGAAMALAGTPLLLVVFGREWLPAAAPLAILCFAVAGLAVADPARTLLVRVGRLSRLSLALGAALAVNVGLVALLVPPLGIVGAAIGSALSYWLAAIALLVLARRHGGPSLGEIFAPPRRDDAAIELVRAAARRLAASGRGSRP